MRNLVEQKQGSVLNSAEYDEMEGLVGGAPIHPVGVPWVRYVLGDEGIVSISAPELSANELSRIRAAFPEAKHVFVQHPVAIEPAARKEPSSAIRVPEEIDRGMMVPRRIPGLERSQRLR